LSGSRRFAPVHPLGKIAHEIFAAVAGPRTAVGMKNAAVFSDCGASWKAGGRSVS
jgi:hypothetical protein